MSEEFWVNMMGHLAPTIAAFAAWRSAKRGTKQTSTTNGHRLGELVELNHDIIGRVNEKLDLHTADDSRHASVCSTCLTIEEAQ